MHTLFHRWVVNPDYHKRNNQRKKSSKMWLSQRETRLFLIKACNNERSALNWDVDWNLLNWKKLLSDFRFRCQSYPYKKKVQFIFFNWMFGETRILGTAKVPKKCLEKSCLALLVQFTQFTFWWRFKREKNANYNRKLRLDFSWCLKNEKIQFSQFQASIVNVFFKANDFL